MKIQINAGEVLNVNDNDKGKIVQVLVTLPTGKEVFDVFYGKTDKQGNVKVFPENIKVGAQYKGSVYMKNFCFPVS